MYSCNQQEQLIKYSGIKRSISLLNTSTIDSPNSLNIFFYGQSIVGGMKSSILIDSLRKRYPTAKISFKSKPIGGFQIPSLVKTAEHDLYHENPDLIIFHAYGGIKDGLFDSFIKRIRKKMSADVLLFDHHFVWDKPKKRLEGINRSHDFDSKEIKKIAKKYDCEYVNVREQWKDYLVNNNIKANELMGNTVDPNVHPNEKGYKLLRSIILSKFTDNKFSDYNIEKDSLRKVIRLENNSKLITSNFEGNRLELKVNQTNSKAKIKILIDNKNPSKYKDSYYISRPSKGFHSWMPGIKKVSFGDKFPVEENWAVTFFDIDRKSKKFKFKIKGSKTGFDGEGNSDKDFLSNSKRILIKKEDFFILEIERILKQEAPSNFQIKFDVVQIVKDTIDISEIKTNYTLFRDVISSNHKVEIKVLEGNVDFNHLISFKPYIDNE